MKYFAVNCYFHVVSFDLDIQPDQQHVFVLGSQLQQSDGAMFQVEDLLDTEEKALLKARLAIIKQTAFLQSEQVRLDQLLYENRLRTNEIRKEQALRVAFVAQGSHPLGR
jgi:hypothetical protein